ncbi:unnamed protein product [Bursaphelenchus okinawaensis]|uniref:F-box domain-containing protein n=1 Tax=Bursaphelenchus okinawaensis TaxID=465554 RepID=A0A811KKV2_9BILA|nr:unnamed protein product [Bursaphelenchus okinawaensis]CAG9106726.1 unnamed protein product [Bursaphelenchus okinawaensis]
MDFVEYFPFEVALQVFSKLTIPEIFTCSKVSKRWKEFLDHNSSWKVKCKKLGIGIGGDQDWKTAFDKVGQNWKDVKCTEKKMEWNNVKSLQFKDEFLLIRMKHELEIRHLDNLDEVYQVIDMEWLEYDFHPFNQNKWLAILESEDTGHLRLRVYPLTKTEKRLPYLFTKQLAPIYYMHAENVFFWDDTLVKSANVDGNQEIHLVNLCNGKLERSFPIGFQRPSIRYDGKYLLYYARKQPIDVFVMETGFFWSIPVENEEFKPRATILSPLKQLLASYSGILFDFYNIETGEKLKRLETNIPNTTDLNYRIFYRQKLLCIFRENQLKVMKFDKNWQDYGYYGQELASHGQIIGLAYRGEALAWVQPSWEVGHLGLLNLETNEFRELGQFEVGFIPEYYLRGSALFVFSVASKEADVRQFSFQPE